jgi:hypothetical protein
VCLFIGREGRRYKNYFAASGSFSVISECFQRSKQKLYIYFSLEQGRLKIKKLSFAHLQKVLIEFSAQEAPIMYLTVVS